MWWVIHMCRGFDPLFSLWQDRARSFGGIFSHPPTPKRSFVVLKLPILTEFDLLGPKFHFSLDLFGSNFQRPATHPHHFSDRVPPPGGAPGIHPDGEQPKTALWLWVLEITWYLYTRGVRGRMKAKQRWFKVTRELCHEWFHHFRHHVHDGHWTGKFATVIWRLHCFTVSFRGDSAENPAPDNSPQSIGELRNGHVANLQELYHTRLVRKWRDLKLWYRC